MSLNKELFFLNSFYNLITKLIWKDLNYCHKTSFEFIFIEIRLKCRLLLIQVEISKGSIGNIYI
jgi:hypothetical protein